MVLVKRGNQTLCHCSCTFHKQSGFCPHPPHLWLILIHEANGSAVNSSTLHCLHQERSEVWWYGMHPKQCLAIKQCSENYCQTNTQNQRRCFLCRYDESWRLLPFSAGFPLTLVYLHVPHGRNCSPSRNKRPPRAVEFARSSASFRKPWIDVPLLFPNHKSWEL